MKRPFDGALATALALALALTACAGPASDENDRPSPSQNTEAGAGEPPVAEGPAPEFQLSDVATGLDTVWALAFDSSGTLHFTERGGRLGRIPASPAGSAGTPVSGEPLFESIEGVREQGEGGLMGLAIDDEDRRFVMYTSNSDNRIVELTDGGQRVLVKGIVAGSVHNGGRLAIGPDGALYATTGEAGDRSLPRRQGLNGRVLRIDPDSGKVGVFTTGHRNPQGLCFTAEGRLLSTEHGPDRGDEVNHLVAGQDYGWPETTGTGLANWSPTVAPAGCTVYSGKLFAGLRGNLLFATLKDRSLHRVVPSADLTSAVSRERLLVGRLGRLRDIVTGPDGALYVATSNSDGRGEVGPGNDRIVRLTPA